MNSKAKPGPNEYAASTHEHTIAMSAINVDGTIATNPSIDCYVRSPDLRVESDLLPNSRDKEQPDERYDKDRSRFQPPPSQWLHDWWIGSVHHSALTRLPSSAVNSNRCPVTHWFRIAFGPLTTFPPASRSPAGKIHPRFTRSLVVRAATPGMTMKLEASHLHTNPDSSSPANTYSSLPLEPCRTNRPQRFRRSEERSIGKE